MRQPIGDNRSSRVSALSSYPSNRQKIPIIPQQNETHRSILRRYFRGFHRRYWKIDCIRTQSYDLLAARIVAIIIWFYFMIIEFVAYSGIMKPSMTTLNFLFGSSYSLKDISAIIYASGSAAYGISIELYIILPFAIINSILAIINCGMNHRETVTSMVYIVKAIALFAGTEFAYQNFKRFKFQQSYKLHYQAASRAMLRQAVYLTVTIIFLVSPGLRSIYSGVRFKCAHSNKTISEARCNLIDIERPVLEDHFSCVADYTGMITSMEQLRIIRDITLCSIGFYSMYNKGFLDITGKTSIIHKIMLLLFFAMGCSILAVNINPLHFTKIKLYFNIIEIIIIVILILLLILNLQPKYAHKETDDYARKSNYFWIDIFILLIKFVDFNTLLLLFR